MRNENGETLPFDVFLSHNSKDKPAVRALLSFLAGAELINACSYLRRKNELDEMQKGILPRPEGGSL